MKHRNMFLKYMIPAGAEGSQDGGSKGGEGEGSGSEGFGSKSGAEGSNSEGAGDNQNKPSEKEAELLKEVMKKKSKISELSDQNKELAEKLAKFDTVDLERYAKLVEQEAENTRKAEEAENDRLKAEGKFDELLASKQAEFDSIVEQMRTQHDDEIKTSSDELTALKESNQKLTRQIEELTVGNAFGNSSFIHDELVSAFTPERTRKLYGEHFDVVDGNIVAFDKPRGVAERAPLVDKNGDNVGFEEALTRIIKSDPDSEAMLRSSIRQGAGSGSSNAGESGDTKIGTGINRIQAALSKG